MQKTEGQRFSPPTRAQLLADLRWLLLSPPLLCESLFEGRIQTFTAQESASIESWLDHLPKVRPDLSARDFEMDSYQRLGRYAEKLLRFFLLNFPGTGLEPCTAYQLVAHNLPLRGPLPMASTQGEIDFLLLDAKEQPWHWEVAVKFFACEPSSHRAAIESVQSGEIIGPNRRDRMSLKIAKLFERQLLHKPPAPFDQLSWAPQAFAKGRIYYWLGEPAPASSFHAGQELLNRQHERGFWCLREETHFIESTYPGASLYPLYRSEWMSPKTPETLDPERTLWSPQANPQALDDEGSLPLMVAVILGEKELARGLILPQDHLSKPVSV